MDNEPYVLIKLPLFVFKWSFVIGTVIFLAYWLLRVFKLNTAIDSIISLGLFYVVAATVINTIVFLGTFIASFWHKEYQGQIVSNAFYLLINIPVAFLYFFLVLSVSF